MSKRILLVEDDETLLTVLQSKLAANNYDVVVAIDGQDTLEKLYSQEFDLVLLDIVMPKKDGFTVLSEIRQNMQFNDLPVIVTSNLGQSGEIHKAINLGANDYIIKANFDIEELIERVNQYLID